MPNKPRKQATKPIEPEQSDDTEGHFMLPDPSASRVLANSRSGDIERGLRERRREKEAKQNQSRGR